jgi:hypothetical protein
MKYIVLGQDIEITKTLFMYERGDELRCKPRVEEETKVKATPEIMSFEASHFEHNTERVMTFNIAPDETVTELKRVFRADIPAVVIYTDKVVKEVCIHKVKVNEHLVECEIENTPFVSEDWNETSFENVKNEQLRKWNKQCVEKDELLNDYCELHNLDKEAVDIRKLRKVVSGKDVCNRVGDVVNLLDIVNDLKDIKKLSYAALGHSRF